MTTMVVSLVCIMDFEPLELIRLVDETFTKELFCSEIHKNLTS